MTEKTESKPKKPASEKQDDIKVIDAVKELTKVVADLAAKINAMKEVHDKWVRAGKF